MSHSTISRHEAELMLERAKADDLWLSKLRSEYRGRHDMLDALWWAAHPLADSPRGTPDPARDLSELQRAVFSRPEAESGMTGRIRESEHRLQEAQRVLAEDRRLLVEALNAVEVAKVGASEAQPLSAPPSGAMEQPEATPSSGDRSPARRKLLFSLLAGAAVIAVILLLPNVSGLTAGVGDGLATTPAPTHTQASRVTTEIVTLVSDGNVSDPLAVLARPATEADQPRTGSHGTESFRRLPDLVGHVELYLSRGEQADQICLTVMRHDGSGMGSCVSESTFADRGVSLGGSDRYEVASNMTILTESFTLLADGTFHYEATARAQTRGGEVFLGG